LGYFRLDPSPAYSCQPLLSKPSSGNLSFCIPLFFQLFFSSFSYSFIVSLSFPLLSLASPFLLCRKGINGRTRILSGLVYLGRCVSCQFFGGGVYCFLFGFHHSCCKIPVLHSPPFHLPRLWWTMSPMNTINLESGGSHRLLKGNISLRLPWAASILFDLR
jgi:hypothetical protein